ncbi:MAG: hypothetical protein LCH84_18280 [Gemmatimonadetes bacterium]|nr:hypothetical protein [Gemmatimonadota bacterium]
MTSRDPHDAFVPDDGADIHEPPLESWMTARVSDALTPRDADIPAERMWQHIAARVPHEMGREMVRDDADAPRGAPPMPAARTRWRTAAAIAALVLLGVAIGRFGMGGTAQGDGEAPRTAAAPGVDASERRTDAPGERVAPDSMVRAAMADHLQQTVTVLAAFERATARDGVAGADADSAARARLRTLLGTTRLLLDDPTLADARTHRLLQDLELVLVQLARVRAAAPATREVADLTLRETNLLPRLRAATVGDGGGMEEP